MVHPKCPAKPWPQRKTRFCSNPLTAGTPVPMGSKGIWRQERAPFFSKVERRLIQVNTLGIPDVLCLGRTNGGN